MTGIYILFAWTLLFATVAWADTVELYCRDSTGAESFAVVVDQVSESLVLNGEAVGARNDGGGSPQYIWRCGHVDASIRYRLLLDRQTLEFDYWELSEGSKITRSGVCQKLELKI